MLKLLNRIFIFTESNITTVYYLFLVFACIPFLSVPYYVTLDGPTHLYNGFLISELWAGNNQMFQDFYEFNTLLVPNWAFQFFTGLFGLFLPDFVVHKLFLILLTLGTGHFLFKLVKFLNPEFGISVVLLIPFLHHHMLYFGFYNLCVGFMLMILAIRLFEQYKTNMTIMKGLKLAFLFLAIYFSHLLPLLMLFLYMGVSSLFMLDRKVGFKKIFKHWLRIVLFAIPALLFSLNYLLKVDSLEDSGYLPLTQLFSWLADIRPVLTVAYQFSWKVFSYLITGSLLLMLFYKLYNKIQRGKNSVTQPIIILWVYVVVLLLLLFLMPNANLMSERLVLFFFVFLCVTLVAESYLKWTNRIVFILATVAFMGLGIKTTKEMLKLSKDVSSIKEVIQDVEPGNILLPLTFSNNWLHEHISCYSGTGSGLIPLRNLEAGLPWFPLVWNQRVFDLSELSIWGNGPEKLACSYYIKNNNNCFSFLRKSGMEEPINYVLVVGNVEYAPTPCNRKSMQFITDNYEELQRNEFATLYKIKRATHLMRDPLPPDPVGH